MWLPAQLFSIASRPTSTLPIATAGRATARFPLISDPSAGPICVIHLFQQHDPDIAQKLFQLVDGSSKVLLIAAVKVERGVDIRTKKPFRPFEAQIGDLVDTALVVDEGEQ